MLDYRDSELKSNFVICLEKTIGVVKDLLPVGKADLYL